MYRFHTPKVLFLNACVLLSLEIFGLRALVFNILQTLFVTDGKLVLQHSVQQQKNMKQH